MRQTTMTQETLLQKTEKAVALVKVLQAERDKALAELATGRTERGQMGAMPARVESSISKTSGSAQLTQPPPKEEQQLELEECRKALQQTKAELENTKDELNREKVRHRLQDMKMRRLKMRQQAS
jgi:hypothetical protein